VQGHLEARKLTVGNSPSGLGIRVRTRGSGLGLGARGGSLLARGWLLLLARGC